MVTLRQWFGLGLLAGASSWAGPADEPVLNDAAQDATGQVWALAHTSQGELYRWDGAHWRAVPVRAAAGAQPVTLGNSSDGSVLCVWNVSIW